MVLFTGKGGVGKTSIAAATAVAAARRGQRVLVTSTDAAHSLADAFASPLGDRPTPIALAGGVDLHAQQLDAQQRLERHWGQVREYLTALLHWGGIDRVAAEELVLLPGLDELFALIDLRGQVATGRYDLIVVDCAPTAETLKLLTLPDALRFYSDRVLGPGRAVARAIAPLARPRGGGDGLPLPGEEVVDAATHLHTQLAEVHALLTDMARTSVRLVVNPERIVLAEAERTATSLSLFGYGIDAVVVNRILPADVVDPYLVRWQQRHREHLTAARAAFAPTPVLEVPLLDDEVIGIDALACLGARTYGERDPAAILHHQRPMEVVTDGADTWLLLSLPFAVEDDLGLSRRGDSLQVTVSGLRRNVPLPSALARRAVAGARLSEGRLEVRFAPQAVEVTPS